jgi:hypothetical protein
MKPSRNDINAEINRIYQEHNGITPSLLVEEAKNPDSILHHLFEWDDEKAGHAYRLDQARQIITSVKVNIVSETKMISAVSYVRDPRVPGDQQGYVSIETLKTDKDLAKESIKLEFARAYSHLQKAKLHAEVLNMQNQVGLLLTNLEETQQEIVG